jgi:dihydrofolate synthase / folylpolyglutamate synthase
MNYNECLKYLADLGQELHGLDFGLGAISHILAELGRPHERYDTAIVAGTNGKGSTCAMLASILEHSGYPTGLFTSPHLVRVNERMRVSGREVSDADFAAAYTAVAAVVERLVNRKKLERPPSFFEFLTATAFLHFAQAGAKFVVLEVGMGGRLDATNVTDPRVALITNIDFDHMEFLGSTLAAIAAEKAGIIKPGATAVLAQQPLEAAEVLIRQAVSVGATVAREGIEFGVLSREQAVGGQQLTLRGLRGTYQDVFLPLFGLYQAGNAACALAAVEAFAGVSDESVYGPAGLDPNLVREAFAKVSSPGRLEVIRRSPTIVIDAAHNPAGMAATVAALQESFSFSHLTGVFAASGDKDVAGMLAELEPALDEIVVTRNSSDRSMDPDETAELAAEIFGEERVRPAPRLDDAIEAAVTLADEAAAESRPGSGAVLITGSVITAGDARRLLAPSGGELPAEPPASQPSRHSFTAAELS